jgi:predicted transcriptional regulator
MNRERQASSDRLPQLTPLELTVMQVVWERGNATAAEVGRALHKARPLADTTIHTVLAKLREKGYIEPIPTVERAFRFAPCIRRDQVARRSLRQLLDEFFGGSPQRLMAHLVQKEKVDETEMAEIQKLFRAVKRRGGEKK